MLQRLQRIWRHRWFDEADTRRAVPADVLERLGRRVAASERRHSGEVRIYVEGSLPMSYLWAERSPRERAVAMFSKLGVWDTESNNGVLIYLLLAEHAIEIVADRGLKPHVAAVSFGMPEPSTRAARGPRCARRGSDCGFWVSELTRRNK